MLLTLDYASFVALPISLLCLFVCLTGWAKTITIFSTFNILFTYFTAFGAASWYCGSDGDAGGGGGGGGGYSDAIVSKQPAALGAPGVSV